MKKLALSFFYTLFLCSVLFAQESQPVKILEKPVPKLTEEQRKENIEAQGTITLMIEFLANGQIGEITPISSLPYGLTENAIEAAKKIKFEPATKNGVPITVAKTILYNFRYGWLTDTPKIEEVAKDEKAEAIVKKAVENLGGEKYLAVKSQIGRGKFHVMRDGSPLVFQTFLDVLIFPDKERTEFKVGGVKNIQTNFNDGGWVFDGMAQTINNQNEAMLDNFKVSVRVSLDNLLRGFWRGKANLAYVGKREAGLGKRNEVIKLVFDDGLAIEFEFSASDGMPVKALYKRRNPDNEEIKEEDRYAQFVDIQGVKTPFIIDHFINGVQTSRINYESMEFNKSIPDSIFAKPAGAKELKKDLKL